VESSQSTPYRYPFVWHRLTAKTKADWNFRPSIDIQILELNTHRIPYILVLFKENKTKVSARQICQVNYENNFHIFRGFCGYKNEHTKVKN